MQQFEENRVYSVDHVDVRVVSGPLAYAEQNRQSIDDNWRRSCAANSTLFDGAIYLAPDASIQNGLFSARFQRTSFATLMYWRLDPEQVRPWHIFGSGIIVSAEGHLIAARMANHNAVAGKIYFPAGSIDDNDISHGRVDYISNMRREVLEETGIDLTEGVPEVSTSLVIANRSIALFRRYQFNMSTDDIVRRIETHIAGENQPELAEIVPFRKAQDAGDDTPSYVRAFTQWHFS